MNTFPPKEIARLAPGEQGFAQFALQVVQIIAADGSHLDRPPREDVLRLLVRGAMTGDPEILASLASELRRLRIPAEAAVDQYIPAAIARIGTAWHNDDIDVLEATIASVRLKNLVRELSRAWHADDVDARDTGSILMIAPEGEQHTLGAMIATAQLRRMGISVALEFGSLWPRIESLMVQRRFDAVFLTIGNRTSLENAATIVKTMERRFRPRPPGVVGGSIPLELDVVKRRVGADFATQDVKSALDFLGLTETRHAAQ